MSYFGGQISQAGSNDRLLWAISQPGNGSTVMVVSKQGRHIR